LITLRFRDRDHIICWAWRTHGKTQTRVMTLAAERPDLTVVRLGGRAEIERWVAGVLAGRGRAI